ncbi:MAG: T9SS type A sorting domain-containing protein [Saprospiraceae bacterium]|nr:T9SS type A sorting domain-containing protein [Saprospiraceae bacterium]
MNNTFWAFCLLITLGACHNSDDFEKIPKNARVNLSGEQERLMTMDPQRKDVPKDRLYGGIKQMKQQIALTKDGLQDGIAAIEWKERGPDHVAGRTRAILLDINDNTKNTLIAGGVSGGLWRTTNLQADAISWTPINDFWANLMVTCIAQAPNDPSRIYVGTGEGWFREDERMKGFGIWASTDGGLTFEQLPITRSEIFSHVLDIVVDDQGVIFASTRMNGVMRSDDQGLSWTQVLGKGVGTGATNRAADLEIGPDQSLYASLGIHSNGSLWKADYNQHGVDRGRNGTWQEITPSQGEYSRIEVAIAPSDANRIYFLAQGLNSDDCKYMYRSENGGRDWASMPIPNTTTRRVFTRGQAWHNLIAAVDPNDADRLFIGGVDLYLSKNAGRTFQQFTHDHGTAHQYVHADQHAILFAEGSSDFILFANDGGVWLTTDGSSDVPTVVDRNKGYNVTQFYSGALHPFAQDYMLGGTQDNGTRQFTDAENWYTEAVNIGDGGFTHIDQDFGFIQVSSYLYNYYWITGDGWQNRRKVTIGRSDGRFINPTDYDSKLNILYSAHDPDRFARISDVGRSNKTQVFPQSIFAGDQISAVTCSPTVQGRVYFGLGRGNVIKIDSADTDNPVSSIIKTGEGYVSCIAVDDGNEDHLLVTYSNYGVISVWETMDGGEVWKPVEGNLPDMPVRWAIFLPGNNRAALLATELGVWGTDELESVQTNWVPINQGMANVRTDMLQYNPRTNRIMAATHGRGVFITDAFEAADNEANYICSWNDFPGELNQISGSSEDQLWGVNTRGDLLTYSNGEWRKILGGVQDVGVGANGGLFAISDGVIYESLTGVTWSGFAGAGKRVDIASDGTPYVISATNYIYVRTDAAWNRISGRGIDIGCGADGSVYMVSNDNTVNKWNGSTWNQIPNSVAQRIDVDIDGLPWVIDLQNQVLRFNGVDWEPMSSEEAQDITCDNDGNTYITTLTGEVKKWSCVSSVDSTLTDSLAMVNDPVRLTKPLELAQARAFPNPFSDQFRVEVPTPMEGKVQLTLFGPRGQERYRYEGKSNLQQILADRDWPAGIYWMTIQYDDKRETIRLIKM